MDRQWAVGYNAGLDRALYSIAYAKTIAPPPNDPLTLEELRGMDGEPVWILTKYDAIKSFWAIVNTKGEQVESYARIELFEYYWSDWLAYRRKRENQKDFVQFRNVETVWMEF